MRATFAVPALSLILILAGCTHLPATNPNIDLVMSAATSTPATPRDGQPLTLNFTIVNRSAAGNTLTNIPWTISRDGASDFKTGTIASLAPGANSAQSVTFAESGGSHTYGIQVAPGNPFSEAVTGNNELFLFITVAGAPAALDLSFNGTPTVIPTAPTTVQLITISFSVKNTSASGTAATNVRYSLSRDRVAGFQNGLIANIPANSSQAAQFQFTEGTPGSHIYTIVLDPGNAIPETDETNNLLDLSVPVTLAGIASR